jgi:hypothetical protein
MRILGKTATTPNYLFGLLPSYFKENDTYVPNSVTGHTTEGLLERYLGLFCEEIDAEVTPYIDDVGLLYDATALIDLPHTSPLKFLDHIAELFGNPPNIGTENQYIILLRYILQIFKTKGTTKSLNLFLAVYGYTISSIIESSENVTKYDATPTPIKYDNLAKYDFGFSFYSGWDLVITDLPGNVPNDPGTTWLTNELKLAIQKFISPIFATLNSVTYTV